jgi:hypothetical protein
MCCYCRCTRMEGVIDRRAWGRRCNQRGGELYYDCVSHTSWSELTIRTNFCGILDVFSYGITVLAKNSLLSLEFPLSVQASENEDLQTQFLGLRACLNLSSVLKKKHLKFRP